jgi:hypothetical protein
MRILLLTFSALRLGLLSQGDVLRYAQHLPLAITVRAVGAPDVALET